MVLLNLLNRLKVEYSWRLVVAHYNHSLRGSESDLDAMFVEEKSNSLGLEFRGEAGDVQGFAKANNLSLEMAGRELRHQFLARIARIQECDRIVLAHHSNDQVELFWMRVLRGVWGSGLNGMRPRSPSPSDKSIQLIRPLLQVSRQELVVFAQEEHIAYREDSSNQAIGIERNMIRHRVLPLLQTASRRPLAELTIRFTQLLAEQQDLITQQAESWLTTRNPKFVSLHPALQREVIHNALIQKGLKPTHNLIEHLLSHSDIPTLATGQLSIRRTADGELVCAETLEEELAYNPTTQSLDLHGDRTRAFFDDWELTVNRSTTPPHGFTSHPAWFDAQMVPKDLVLRHWRPGDRFHRIGMEKPTKLQDIFVNSKTPLALRRKLVVVAQTNGSIVWVESIGVSDPYKVSPQTTEFLRLEWHRLSFGLETD